MNRNNTLLEFDSHEFQNAMQKKGLSLRKIAKLTGIDRKTLYNAMLTGKVTYRTAKMLDAAHLAKFDMVNVIRCKDCKHWLPHEQFGYDADNDEYHNYCGRLVPDDDYYAFTREADEFCSRAERKEDDNYIAPSLLEFMMAIPDFEDRGVEHTAPCPCGGTIHAIRSTYNGHIHARCDKCKASLME